MATYGENAPARTRKLAGSYFRDNAKIEIETFCRPKIQTKQWETRINVLDARTNAKRSR